MNLEGGWDLHGREIDYYSAYAVIISEEGSHGLTC